MSVWPKARIGDLAHWRGGLTPSMGNPNFWANGDIPWISSKEVVGGVLRDTERKVTRQAIEETSLRLVPAGSVAVVVRSGILLHTFPVALVPFEATVNQDVKIGTPMEGVLPEYLAFCLQANGEQILQRFRKTGTTVQSVDVSGLLGFEVPLPPVHEQRRIVDLISALDVQIGALGTEKDDVLMLRAILMSDHVAGCETRSSLGTFVDVAQGKALPKERQGVTSGPVPWFKIADMTGAGNQFGYNRADTSMTPAEIAALRGKILPIGSVVFPRVGAAVLTEKKRLVEVEGAVDENHLVLLPRQGTDSEYLLALMEWVKLSELVQSGAVPSLNMSLIRNLDVPIADPETQRALGSVLGHLRVLGRALDDEIGAARMLRAITLANVLSSGFEIPQSYDALLAEAV